MKCCLLKRLSKIKLRKRRNVIEKENCIIRTSSTPHHQDISSRSRDSNSNKRPDLEGALARSRVRATFTRRVASSSWRIANLRSKCIRSCCKRGRLLAEPPRQESWERTCHCRLAADCGKVQTQCDDVHIVEKLERQPGRKIVHVWITGSRGFPLFAMFYLHGAKTLSYLSITRPALL